MLEVYALFVCFINRAHSKPGNQSLEEGMAKVPRDTVASVFVQKKWVQMMTRLSF